MITRLYAIRDLKADAFAPPFFFARDELALRAFQDAIADPQHPMSRHRPDYSLHHLGEFDDASGILTPCIGGPRFLANAVGDIGDQEPQNG